MWTELHEGDVPDHYGGRGRRRRSHYITNVGLYRAEVGLPRVSHVYDSGRLHHRVRDKLVFLRRLPVPGRWTPTGGNSFT